MPKLVVHTDGGCRSNPGPGAWGFVLLYEDGRVVERSGYLAQCTNNQAEYRALEAACVTMLQMLDDIPEIVSIFSDSQLIVNQINGYWQVKDETLRPYFDSASRRFKELKRSRQATLSWFRREHNTRADALCNLVMDRHGVVCSRKGNKRGSV